MRFAVIGGDKRSALLCSMLTADGHKVQSFALERAELPEMLSRAGCLQSCVYGADCVILPTPAEKGGILNAPFSSEKIAMGELLSVLWPGQIICGGKFSENSCLEAIKNRLHIEDLMQRADFVVPNAALTAECALGLLIRESEDCLWKSRVLICGFGRIGKILALRLRALGAEVTVAARKSGDRAMAEAFSCRGVDYGELEGIMEEFNYIVNTVPSRILSDAMLCCAGADTLIMELASPPGGFDKTLGANIGLKVIDGGGLPGKYAPYAAARVMKQAVYAAIKEMKE